MTYRVAFVHVPLERTETGIPALIAYVRDLTYAVLRMTLAT
jgi:hypothetical protein